MIIRKTLAILAVLALVAPAVQADVLSIDFGKDDKVQAGYEYSGTSGGTYTSTLGTGSSVTIATTGSAVYRYRSDYPSLLAGDFLFNQDSIVFSGLKAGTYAITTYHHDSDSSVGGGDLDVTDALGTEKRLRAYERSGGATGPVQQYTTLIVANGTDDVTLGFSGKGNSRIISGFDLDSAPVLPTNLRVDFGETEDDTADGFQGMNQNASAASESFLTNIGIDGHATIDVTMTGGVKKFADRGGTDPLYKDILMASDKIELVLSNIEAGTYDILLHQGADGSDYTGNVDVLVNDSLALSAIQEDGDAFGVWTLEDVVFDGVNPVTISYQDAAQGAPTYLTLAGIEVVPEPATMALLGLGGLGALLKRRR